MLEDSCQLLTQEERTALAYLSLFPGSFSPEAAALIAGATPAIRARLCDLSLLHRDTHKRYRLHLFVKQLAAAQWRYLAPAHVTMTTAQYGRYYLALRRGQESAFTGATS